MMSGNKGPSRRIDKVERTGNELFLNSEHGSFRIAVIKDSIIRVTYAPKGRFDTSSKPGVINNAPVSDWNYSDNADSIELKTAKVTLRIDRQKAILSWLDENGKLLLTEDSERPTSFEEYPTYMLTGRSQETQVISTPDGEKTLIKDAEKEFCGNSYHITWAPKWGDEALYGLGQHEEGYGNLRGKTVYVHQANRKIAVPMLVSTAGYGILVDCYSPMIFNDANPEPYIYVESAHELDYYFIVGNMPEVTAGYRYLTGKATMLPKWAFGFLQSEERYETAEEILETEKTARERGIGIDCVVLDWISWGDGLWGQKTFDKKRFPDPAGMISELHKDHTHFMISVWPTADQKCDNHAEFASEGQFLKASNVYNAMSARGRELYWKQLSEEHWPSGVDAWWCDSSEPITPEWGKRNRPEPSAAYYEFFREMGLRISDELSNSFCLFHAQGIYEGQRKAMALEAKADPDYRDKRVCNLTRSAYTGQQRYGTIMWSGDIEAKWSTLRKQIGAGLNFCASGIPYWTVDVGAFFVKPGDFWYWNGDYERGCDDPGYRELYVRWYQWACFLPVFRCHGTDCHRELWHYGDKGEMFYDALVACNHLRYELMPFIYSEAGKVWLKDGSLIANLATFWPEDKTVWDITDQYMFGGALMVCPVTDPMYYGVGGEAIENKAFSRKVYLPEGTLWYDFYTGEKYEGGQWIEAEAPIDRIPVFVKNGSIIPMTEFALSTEEQTAEVTFKVFSDHPCEYEMYEDAGDGYGYERGEYTLKTISSEVC